jgi:putative peptidoglycan lipid II flippase
MGGTTVVDQAMAAMLPAGSVAALSYGSKTVAVAVGIGATALSTAALPYFSRMVAENDWDGCRQALRRHSLLVVAASVPITLGLIVFSMPLVRLLFERGAFTPADTRVVGWVQICYAIQIPFTIWNRLFGRFVAAMRRNDVLLSASAISLVLDIGLNLVLMRVWGVAGIALSTSLVYIVTLVLLSAWSTTLLRREESKGAAAALARTGTP